MLQNDEISSTNAQEAVRILLNEGGDTDVIVDAKGLRQVNDTSAMEAIVDAVLAASPAQIAEYRAGKVNLFGYFVGNCMKESKGQGNPKIFTEILTRKLTQG